MEESRQKNVEMVMKVVKEWDDLDSELEADGKGQKRFWARWRNLGGKGRER